MFFRKKKKEEIVDNTTENIEVEFKCEYNQNDECNLLRQLKEKQKLLEEVNAKIKESQDVKFEFPAFYSFMKKLEKNGVEMGRIYDPYIIGLPKNYKFEKHIEHYGDKYIKKVLWDLSSESALDNIFNELKLAYQNQIITKELLMSRTTLIYEITELKEKLGIK